MDHYTTLGVSENASQEEIKKAYRKLANQHHPDKGGDQAKFKDISVAYDTLGDANKKAEYDNQRRYGGGPQVRFTTDGHDPFSHMFGGGNPFPHGHPFADIFGGRRVQRNRDLNIQCQISLLDSFQGKQLEAQYQLPSGRSQTVVINVPPGIDHGATIRYSGLGDDSIQGMQRGDLNVTIIVLPDVNFERRGNDLYTSVDVSPIEAMIGVTKTIKTITGSTIDLVIRPGVESGVEFASAGQGFSQVQTGAVGRFVTVVRIKTPAIIDPALVERLKALNAEISQGI